MGNMISTSQLSMLMSGTLPEFKQDPEDIKKWRCICDGGVIVLSKLYKINDETICLNRHKSTLETANMYNTISAYALREICEKRIAESEKRLLELNNMPDDDFEGDWKCVYEEKE